MALQSNWVQGQGKHLPVVRPWKGDLTFVTFTFLICKKFRIIPTSQVYYANLKDYQGATLMFSRLSVPGNDCMLVFFTVSPFLSS